MWAAPSTQEVVRSLYIPISCEHKHLVSSSCYLSYIDPYIDPEGGARPRRALLVFVGLSKMKVFWGGCPEGRFGCVQKKGGFPPQCSGFREIEEARCFVLHRVFHTRELCPSRVRVSQPRRLRNVVRSLDATKRCNPCLVSARILVGRGCVVLVGLSRRKIRDFSLDVVILLRFQKPVDLSCTGSSTLWGATLTEGLA